MSRDAAANPTVLESVEVQFDAVPGVSPLFLEFVSGLSPESDLFWPSRDDSLTDYSKVALQTYSTNRDALCDGLFAENKEYGMTAQTLANIESLRRQHCVAVVTGQQSGFLGGPAYTVYKALTAIRIASDLVKLGVEAVPVFWIATEDHDFEEIRDVRFRGVSGNLVTGTLVRDESESGGAVGNIRIKDESISEIEEVFSGIPVTRFSAETRELVSSCFKPGRTLGRAFGTLLTAILGKYGLVFVNPLNPAVRAMSSEIFASSIERLDAIGERLYERDALLVKHGFHSQVRVNEGFVPFFAFDKNGERKALRKSDKGRIESKDSELVFDKAELLKIARNEPARLSPNALLRPVVQDAVFPTVCYVGGAAEICYFAQNAVIYEALDRPVTPVKHRAAFTVFETRHRRTMQKYDIGISGLFEGRAPVFADLARKFADPELIDLFEETRIAFEAQLSKIESALSRRAPDVAKNLQNRKKKILWHVGALREKFVRSQAKNNEDLSRRLDDLFNSAMPGGYLQERTVSYLDFLNMHGPNFTDWIYTHVDGNGNTHKGLFF